MSKNPSPLITVSIVTYQTDLTTLKDTIASLRECTLSIELVIIDNTQDEDYFELIKKETGEHCVRSPVNKGYGFGHNLSLKYLPAAPYHLVLNPDVIIHSGCLEKMFEMMEGNPEIGLGTPKILNKDETLQLLNKHNPNVLDLLIRRFVPKPIQETRLIRRYMDKYVMLDYGYEISYEVPFASGCFMFFRREILNKIGGFDENFFMYFEDADISRRAADASKVQYCPQAVITHLWARHSHKKLQATIFSLKSAYQYFQKWGWKWF